MRWKSEKNFEDEVADIFKERGFSIERETWISNRAAVGCTVADVIATKNDDKFVLDVKGRSVLHPSDIVPFAKLKEADVLPNANFIIVTPDEPNSDIKELALRLGVRVVRKADLPNVLKSKR